MKGWIPLWRRPGKTGLGILLVMLAGTLLCLSVGQCFAALQTQAKVEQDYVTVALPTGKYQQQNILDENGETVGVTYLPSQPQEVMDFLASLPDAAPDIVKSMAYHGLISGYCPSLTPLNYAEVGTALSADAPRALDTIPYTCAMFVIQLEEIGSAEPFATADMMWGDSDPAGYGVAAMLTGTIREVVFLQDGYPDPTGRTVRISLRLESDAQLQSLSLEQGQNYLIYGTDYQDLDWQLRCKIANGDAELFSEVDWSHIRMLSEEEIQQLDQESFQISGAETPYRAVYEGGLYLTQEDLDWVDCSSLTICTNPLLYIGQLGAEEVLLSDGNSVQTISATDYILRYGQAGITAIPGSASAFLQTTKDEAWLQALDCLQINRHAFPVVATPNLRAMAQFAIEDAMLSEGRSFTQQEYDKGSRVCVISEALAAANGISVGDSISLGFYERDENIPYQPFAKTANPSAAYYSPQLGFAAEEEAYEVVGIYRQKNAWTEDEYAFTPNTIFVPEQAVTCQTTTSDSGIFRTITLENGTQDAMEALLAANNLSGLFVYYDQGYSVMQSSLQSYFSVSTTVVAVGLGAWAGLILLYLLLFPLQQRKEIRRMWALGVPLGQIRRYLMETAAGILLPGLLLGGVLGAVLLDAVTSRIGTAAGAEVTLSHTAEMMLALTGVQALCLAVILYLLTGYLLRSLKDAPGRSRR